MQDWWRWRMKLFVTHQLPVSDQKGKTFCDKLIFSEPCSSCLERRNRRIVHVGECHRRTWLVPHICAGVEAKFVGSTTHWRCYQHFSNVTSNVDIAWRQVDSKRRFVTGCRISVHSSKLLTFSCPNPSFSSTHQKVAFLWQDRTWVESPHIWTHLGLFRLCFRLAALSQVEIIN